MSVFFFLSLMMRICALDGIIVENFLECILLLLKEDGDDQPLILQTKLILKETLMIVHVKHEVKQFGLPDATEQLSLFRLWLCENFILQVSQREIKNSFIFKTLFKYLVPSIVSCCSSALSNIASVSLTFEFNPIQIQ